MEYDRKTLIIAGICIIIGVVFMLLGIITSEIEIRKNQSEEIYDNINN